METLSSKRLTRVRFAPSPTGYLHIGGVRTALYNYLFARKNKGKFILRIEDTDVKRSDESYTKVILDGLKWLGLDWDEGPYFQSKRSDLYKKALEKLIDEDKVYRCYCSSEELKEKRELALKQGKTPGYDGACRNFTPQQEEEYKSRGLKPVYRLKTPQTGKIVFDDIIKGKNEVDAEIIRDFIIIKSDGMPTYNFACVVDDIDLKISHIIRGDDHLSNTPKQLLIYKILGEEPPEFAHLPQVHGTDGKRLSKRTGAVSLHEYKEKGYLPEALKNYLALLGWSTEDSQQLFERDELIEKFELSRCGTSAGIFDMEKLNWMNGKYIRSESTEELVALAAGWLIDSKIIKDAGEIPDMVTKAIELEKEKIRFLTDIPERIDFIVKDDIKYADDAVKKRLKKEGVRQILEDISEIFKNTEEFTVKELEPAVKEYCEKNNLGAGKVFHPVRVAISGRMKGPGLFDMLELIGKERVIKRIKYTLENIM